MSVFIILLFFCVFFFCCKSTKTFFFLRSYRIATSYVFKCITSRRSTLFTQFFFPLPLLGSNLFGFEAYHPNKALYLKCTGTIRGPMARWGSCYNCINGLKYKRAPNPNPICKNIGRRREWMEFSSCKFHKCHISKPHQWEIQESCILKLNKSYDEKKKQGWKITPHLQPITVLWCTHQTYACNIVYCTQHCFFNLPKP